MDLKTLQMAAENVIDAIDTAPPKHVSTDVLASIKTQMVFIRDKAAAGKNPSTELATGTTFTYAILASRELTSLDEMALQVLIDKVSNILIKN